MQSVPRLINQFIPSQYHLSLELDRPNRSFKGIVTIEGTSPKSTGTIIVHAKDLTIESATIDGKQAMYSSHANDELRLTHQDIGVGHHVVVIAFSGKITDAMYGLYPCYYEHEGSKKELLATQFESHHAREVFPCIDEPEAKATFDVTLTTEQHITVLGNMPIKRQAVENDKLVTQFTTTPRMSTYLVAWVTGELHRKTATTTSGVEVNVWATPTQPSESLEFALQHAVRTIDFFDNYFGIPYPLPKCDHVALPDFTSGAMENWGLINYREVALLTHPTKSSISSRQYVAIVVAHELSHQWFGNLVTMKWWSDLWLNESFATLMEYIAVDALYPNWNMWLDFSTQETILALRRDSIDSVQPVQTEVRHPDEIATLFDGAIVYAKGARLLRMLQHYIGHDAFRTGLRAYFQVHAYHNTDGEDLWEALETASGKPIRHFMHTWISQSGYPVVAVNYTDEQLQLRQKQFFIGPHASSERLWPIPLNSSDNRLPEVLNMPETTIPYFQKSDLRLNVGDTAHFLTQYDDRLFGSLIKKIDRLPPLDRLQLLHERIMLARGGVVSSVSLIPLLQSYQSETVEAVWDIISLAISELKKFVETDPISERKLQSLARQLAIRQYERLGWQPSPDGEPETDSKLRAIILGLLLYGEDKAIISTALELYENTALDQLPPELRSLILGAAVRFGKPSAAKTLLTAYQHTTSAELREDIAAALTSTKRSRDINVLLATIKDRGVVRAQDVTHWYVWLIRNRYGREQTWQWLQTNWDWIVKTFGGDKSYDDFPRYTATSLMTNQQLDEFKSFFEPMRSEPALARIISLGVSEIEGRIALLERDSVAVHKVLAELD